LIERADGIDAGVHADDRRQSGRRSYPAQPRTICVRSAHRVTSEVAIALSQHGTVSPSIIHQRVGFATSMTDGRTVMEIQGQKRASEEIA